MDRLPVWVWWIGVVVFAALAIWSATDENWSGVIAGGVLAVLCLVAALRRRPV